VGKTSPRGRQRAIILYGDLAEAVKRESEQAVAHWFGVGLDTAWRWRQALGVGATTEGTSQLRSDDAFEPVQTAARAKAHQKARDPQRCARIAAAKRGVPRPAHVREALLQASIGSKPNDETLRKMSEAH
jgi:hypothetical protein